VVGNCGVFVSIAQDAFRWASARKCSSQNARIQPIQAVKHEKHELLIKKLVITEIRQMRCCASGDVLGRADCVGCEGVAGKHKN
jgi:hypothetical protein